MALLLFAIIAWIAIIIFSVIPKSLNIIDNIIIFFCTTIMVTNIFSIITLNLKLIENSKKTDMFISLLIHRNMIIPICILIYINLLTFFKERLKRIGLSIITLLILVFIELLTVWNGIKLYKGWNIYLNVIAMLILMTLSTFLTAVLKRIK